ncbi:hypothetical protein BC829DRAFT_281055 [Chytridium lagenaria]|nr:hypothetical protein BC829DRAFT_281055 [Chytridium lagenaria]
MNVLLVEDVASQASYKSIESLDGYRGSLSGPSRHLEPLAPPSSWAPSAASTPRSGTPPSSGETKYKTATVVVADLSMAKEKSKAGKKIDPSPSPSAWTVSSPPPQNEAKAEKPQSRGSRASLSIESGPKSAGANFYLRRKTLPSRPFASAAPHRRKSSFAPEIPSSLGYTDVAIGSSSARLKRDDEDFKARSSSDSIHKSGSSKVKNKK